MTRLPYTLARSLEALGALTIAAAITWAASSAYTAVTNAGVPWPLLPLALAPAAGALARLAREGRQLWDRWANWRDTRAEQLSTWLAARSSRATTAEEVAT